MQSRTSMAARRLTDAERRSRTGQIEESFDRRAWRGTTIPAATPAGSG